MVFTAFIKVDSKGNPRLQKQDEWDQFFASIPGKRCVIRVQSLPSEDTRAMVGKYYLDVLPKFQQKLADLGDHMTLESLDKMLREDCSVCREELPDEECNGFDLIRVKRVNDLDFEELKMFFFQLADIATKFEIQI
jgi:hypothetical protein